MPRVIIDSKQGIQTKGGTGLRLNDGDVTATATQLNQTVLTTELKNISAASETFTISPHAGTLTAAYSIIDGSISGGNAILTIKIGGSTAGTITIAHAGSAAKDVDSNTSLSTSVAAGQAIEIETDGGSTGTRKANLTLVIER